MGYKRSLWASIQTDTKRPARRKIIKTSDDNEFKEIPGTSSSMPAPPMLQDSPLVNDDIVSALKTAGVPRMIAPVQYQIKEEEHQPLQLEHPPMALDSQQSTQDILHPPMADLAIPEPYRMRTPPAKSPSRDSVSATRRAKARALAEKKSLNLLTVQTKTANSCHSRRQVIRQSLTVVHLHLVLDYAAVSVTLDLHHAVSQQLSGRLPSLLRWDYSHHSCSRLLSSIK